MTPRSLVGMTQGARKRAWLAGRIDAIVFPDGINTDELEMKSAYSWSEIRRWWQPFGWQLLGQRLRPCPGCAQCLRCQCGNSASCIGLYEAWTKHQKAEPACNECCGHGCEDGHCDKVDDICDGSGVLPARAKKVMR